MSSSYHAIVAITIATMAWQWRNSKSKMIILQQNIILVIMSIEISIYQSMCFVKGKVWNIKH